MDKIVYGKVLPPPTKATAAAFGSNDVPISVKGGQNTAYVAGDVILKPAATPEEASWIAEVFSKLPTIPQVRFARPIRTITGEWISDGYVAWTFLRGEHVPRQYAEKLNASLAFHRLLRGATEPYFLSTPDSSWTAATDAILNGQFDYDQEFMDLYYQIETHLKPLPNDRQLVHGDLSGNFLYEPGIVPAIIDFSPTWAPYGFSEGIMLADCIVWEDASVDGLEPFKKYPEIVHLAWWGALRRIAEQAEHIRWFGKNKEEAVKEARTFQRAIDVLKQCSEPN
jgi:hypothetical protein